MIITLYNNISDNIMVNKTLTNPVTLTCNIHESKDDTHISFIIDYSTESYTKNYCHVADLNRYYFIERREITTGKRLIIHCSTDVIQSFKNNLLKATVTATRSNFRNNKIKDNLIMDVPSVKIQYRKLGSALTGETYVAMIGGK